MSKSKQIIKLLSQGKSVKEIARRLKVRSQYVYTVRWIEANKKQTTISKNHTSNLAKSIKNTTAHFAAIEKKPSHGWIRVCPTLPEGESPTPLPTPDPVNHPPHYKAGGIETIDYIEAKDFNYRLGNVIKYVSRAGKKEGVDPVQDLEKAAWYLQREIDARKSA